VSTLPSASSGRDARAWQHRAHDLGALLPPGFQIGTGTTAFSVEGGARDGGRGESVWDAFTTQPGRIRDGSNASVASDHYHRHAEDVTLMRELGADAYSFSFAWPRLQPSGKGALTIDGIAFYDRLLDELLAAGIRPTATLSSWDTPLALRGGWRNRDTAMRFGDYAYAIGGVFGDRIDGWITLTEPSTVTLNGYALGMHAPGDALLFDALPTAHHQLLAHGLGVQGLRAADVRGRIGIANAHSPVQPATDREDDRVAADLFDVLHNRIFADAVLLGRYPELPEFARELRPLSDVDEDDLGTISQPLDFYGLGYTHPTRVSAVHTGTAALAAGGPGRGEAPGAGGFPFRTEQLKEFPVTGSGQAIAPEYLGVALAELHARYGDALLPVYLTGIGAGFPDPADEDGNVSDVARIDYLAEHLSAVGAAVAPGGPAAGVDLRGVFIHSLLDGFEWTEGYTQRYGLVSVDFADRRRTPKLSYRWLQKVLASR
jgi:beta-glucosidase